MVSNQETNQPPKQHFQPTGGPVNSALPSKEDGNPASSARVPDSPSKVIDTAIPAGKHNEKLVVYSMGVARLQALHRALEVGVVACRLKVAKSHTRPQVS